MTKKSGFANELPVNKSIEWYTPKYIFDALGLEFDLDPCSPGLDKCHVPAKNCFTIEQDGLNQEWFGNVFLNPPYGKQTPYWVRKLSSHGSGIALLFSRTDARWFQDDMKDYDIICFISKRIKFHNGNKIDIQQNPTNGSMLVGWGDINVNAILNSGLGACFSRIN